MLIRKNTPRPSTARPALFAPLMLALLTCASVQAQPAATPGTPAAATSPPPAPSWQQGRSAAQDKSTLHPIAPILTGRPAGELAVDKLKVPAGFKVEVWVDGVPEARSMALGDKGTLYVAERHQIVRYDGIEDRLDNPPAAQVVVGDLDPDKQAGHFWKYGPDGKLYYNVGAPGNIVMPGYFQATVNRVDPATGKVETVAQGVRNSVGMDFHPKTRELWFTNHARHWIDDDTPHDTLHRVSRKGMNFGYPYCHQGDFADPEFGKTRTCAEFDKPFMKLGAHIAPLGMKFYTGKAFPAE